MKEAFNYRKSAPWDDITGRDNFPWLRNSFFCPVVPKASTHWRIIWKPWGPQVIIRKCLISKYHPLPLSAFHRHSYANKTSASWKLCIFAITSLVFVSFNQIAHDYKVSNIKQFYTWKWRLNEIILDGWLSLQVDPWTWKHTKMATVKQDSYVLTM